MAATLDKDTLVKHSFWILAGGYVVLVLACLSILMTSVSATVEDEKEKLKKAQKLAQDVKGDKNELVVDAFKKQDQLVDHKKEEVWGKAWDTQKDMMTWPRDLQSQFQKYKYFGLDIDQFDRAAFDEKYRTQFEEVWKVVDPVLPNGEGVVQCKGGFDSWGEMLQLDRTFDKKPPHKDDIWLTQEDLWVKREMLRIIHDANQSVARFKEVTSSDSAEKEIKAGSPAEKDANPTKPDAAAAPQDQKKAKPAPTPTKTDPNHKIFRNPYWEFDLTLAADRGKYALRGKITNISKRKQPLDTKFKVFLQDPRTADEPSSQLLNLFHLPLAVGESVPVEATVQEQKAIEGLFGIEQVLNWRTAAVKRLDNLELRYLSSRTAARTLKPPKFINTNPPESADSSGDASAQTAPAAPERAGPSYGPAAAQALTTTTLNGLEINRYTDVGEQVRHMPVAMVVVVDEEHVPELLAAFVNSKLRIQITQYHWHHCRDRMKPQLDEEGTPQPAPSSGFRGERALTPTPTTRPGTLAGGAYRANNPLLRGGGERGATRPPPGPAYLSGPPGRMPAGPGPATMPRGIQPGMRPPAYPGSGPGTISEGDEEQEDLNLLEVAVYGLASLYERYPPEKKAAESGTPDEKKPADNATGSK